MPGANPLSITSANSAILLAQAILFPSPQPIQQFATDDIFDVDSIKIAETRMGADGVLSGGFVWAAVPVTLNLQANSPSRFFFDTIFTQSMAAQDVYPIDGQIKLPGIQTKFNLTNGFLEDYKPAPAGRRTLEPLRYRIVFNLIAPAPA